MRFGKLRDRMNSSFDVCIPIISKSPIRIMDETDEFLVLDGRVMRWVLMRAQMK